MPIKVFGSTSGNIEKKMIQPYLEKKPYLKTNDIESIIAEDIDMKSQYGIKNLKVLTCIREAASKNYVDTLINYPRFKKTLHKLTSLITV